MIPVTHLQRTGPIKANIRAHSLHAQIGSLMITLLHLFSQHASISRLSSPAFWWALCSVQDFSSASCALHDKRRGWQTAHKVYRGTFEKYTINTFKMDLSFGAQPFPICVLHQVI